MKTRERILHVSLELFNDCGEPNVTTIDIANEMEISPGNLYYHYRNKDDIVFEIFKRFESEIGEILNDPDELPLQMMDIWMYIHMIFEKIWEYRFMYRDLASILERNSTLHSRFNRVIEKKMRAFQTICENLIERGSLSISSEDIKVLANNIALTATYWINFQHVRKRSINEEEIINSGVLQLMSLVAPYLEAEERAMFTEVSQDNAVA